MALKRWTENEIASVIEAYNTKIRSVEPSLQGIQPPETTVAGFLAKTETHTARELDREVRRLERYLKPGAEKAVKLDSGEVVARWTRNEVNNILASINRRNRNLAKAHPPSPERGTLTYRDISRGKVMRKSRLGQLRGAELTDYIGNLWAEGTESQFSAFSRYQHEYGQVLDKSTVTPYLGNALEGWIRKMPADMLNDMYYFSIELRPEWLYEPTEEQAWDYYQGYAKALDEYMSKNATKKQLKEYIEATGRLSELLGML